MNTISAHDLKKVLETEPQTVLLDVRTPVEYAAIHITQARNAPLGNLRESDWSQARQVYLVCMTGARAAKAAEQFNGRGVVVQGGPQEWEAAGLNIVRQPIKTISLERQVRIAAGVLVLTGVILARLVHPWFIGLSAFVGAGLIFAGATGWCGMALLLARLPWNTRCACTKH